MRWFVFLLLLGCRTYDYVSTPSPTSERIEERYARPSADTPEALRPFYDPGLTQALNR